MTPRNGLQLIPGGAKITATLVFAAIVGLCYWFLDGHHAPGFGAILGFGMGAVVAGFILLAGYVFADAARRGMPPIPWTLLTLLIPNGLGFVLYFLLRKPIVHPCSRCGHGVAPDAAFCPKCGQPQ
jgi:hypothetical protein